MVWAANDRGLFPHQEGKKQMSKKKEEEKVTLGTSEQQSFDPKAFDRLFDKLSKPASAGETPEPMRKRRAKFVVGKSVVRPGTFDSDIQLTLEELNSNDEEEVLATLVTSSPASMSIALAKKALVEVNGRRLQPHEIDIVWDAISFGGRTAAGNIYLAHCSGADEATLGNSLMSVIIE